MTPEDKARYLLAQAARFREEADVLDARARRAAYVFLDDATRLRQAAAEHDRQAASIERSGLSNPAYYYS